MKPESESKMVVLVLATADTDEGARERAVASLEDCGPPSEAEAAPLAKLLADARPDVAYWAATLLGRLQLAAEPHTAALVAALQSHPLLAVRERAAWALGQIGVGAKTATPALEQAAASGEPRLARLANEALKQIDA